MQAGEIKREIDVSFSANSSGWLKAPHFVTGPLGESLEGNGRWARREKTPRHGRQREQGGRRREICFFCWAHAQQPPSRLFCEAGSASSAGPYF